MPVGIDPSIFSFTVEDVDALFDVEASDNSKLDWDALDLDVDGDMAEDFADLSLQLCTGSRCILLL